MLKSNIFHSCIQTSLITLLLSVSVTCIAEEGGSGHYFPGSIASIVDGVPTEPSFAIRLNAVQYDAVLKVERNDPMVGLINSEVKTKINGIALTMLWSPDWLTGSKWNYAMSATIPFIKNDITATLKSNFFDRMSRDKRSGIGDIILIPLMFNYEHSTNLNSNYRLFIYAPTGRYDTDRLANTGKNFWTFTPTASVNYFGRENGIEASLFVGVDFNTRNNDTKYRSGTQTHIDGTLAQHFKISSGIAGIGITGFRYQQIKGDSGDGALLGDFKAKANGIGPVISYIKKTNGNIIIAKLKWLHEFDSKNRFQGDTLFFKLSSKF